jgi:hypothetical protein
MSNSNLVDYTRISPNKNPRKNDTYNPSGKVTKITIHHAAGVASVEGLGNTFSKESRQASSNYGIGADCRVGLYVPEDHRAWTSGSRTNDYQAITIEVANSAKGGNWPVSDEVLAKLIDLCVDICQRNGIEKINFTGNVYGNLTMHKYFEATSCPGPYLESKFPYIAEEVNKRLAPVEDNGIYCVSVDGLSKAEADKIAQYAKDIGHAATVTKTGAADPEKPAEAEKPAEPENEWIPSEGDIVQFNGGVQHANANAATGSKAAAGLAKITKIVLGKKHPYHLVKTGKTGPYGWCDRDDFDQA